MLVKLLVMFPQLALPSPKLAEYDDWAMVFYRKCWCNVEMVERFVGGLRGRVNIQCPGLKKAGRCGLLWHNYSPIICF